MSVVQRNLFPLPAVRTPVPVTPPQLFLLDWLQLGDGTPPPKLSRQALRNLINRGFVERVGNAPALYRLTGYGRAVRMLRRRP